MKKSIRILLDSAIDYAGLFPPAGLSMSEAVGIYATSLRGSESWALGRFVLPIYRIEEFEKAAGDFLPRDPGAAPWRLSVLAGIDGGSDLDRVSAFNLRHAGSGGGRACVIESIEITVRNEEDILRANGTGCAQFETYFEVPLRDGTGVLIRAIAKSGGRAKVRTGGLTQDQFPAPAELAEFILECAAANLPFKATAGLHHPIRALHRLNYTPASPSTTMQGFLNLLMAASFACAGLSEEIVKPVLEDQSPDSFRFEEEGAYWGRHLLSNDQLMRTRQNSVISFGSCSFREPIDDLKAMNLL